MEKWSVELNCFHIDYEPRTAIKGQVLADFISEFHDDTVVETVQPAPPTGGQNVDSGPPEANMSKQMEKLDIREDQELAWNMHIDGASNKNGAGMGVILKSPEGTVLELGVILGFEASNN